MAKIQELPTESTLTDEHLIITQENSETADTKHTPLSLLKSFLNLVGIFASTDKTAERFNDYTYDSSSYQAGSYSHSEGYHTESSGKFSHAEGNTSIASGETSHAEGNSTKATGHQSHAEGQSTTASGQASHAEGSSTASGDFSHAEGIQTTASQSGAHAEGGWSVASAPYSHAGGDSTIASGYAQTAIGTYNEEDKNALLIVGCGSYNERKNAFIVDKSGNVKVLGTISAEGGFEGIESGGSINVWTKETTYKVDDIVVNDTTIYKCVVEHTSGTEFDSTNWTALTGEQGEDGVTPHIDETTKHWFIGDEDTGVLAEGTTTVTTSAVVYNGSLIADSWVGDSAPYTQTIVMNNITESMRPYLYPVLSDDVETGLEQQKQWSYITKAVTSNGVITFSCYKTKPTVDLNFEAEVR